MTFKISGAALLGLLLTAGLPAAEDCNKWAYNKCETGGLTETGIKEAIQCYEKRERKRNASVAACVGNQACFDNRIMGLHEAQNDIDACKDALDMDEPTRARINQCWRGFYAVGSGCRTDSPHTATYLKMPIPNSVRAKMTFKDGTCRITGVWCRDLTRGKWHLQAHSSSVDFRNWVYCAFAGELREMIHRAPGWDTSPC